MARICVRLCVSSEYSELVANFILGVTKVSVMNV